MEVIKSYRVPIEPPKDLIEAYFNTKNTLEFILSRVKVSEKAKVHLKLRSDELKEFRSGLLKDWRFSKHYVDSAINSVIGLVKGWITLYNNGKTKGKPKITRKTVYIKNTLFS